MPPIMIPLTHRPTLTRNRSRATALFLQDMVVDEVQERLKEVNRTFTSPAVVTGFPHLWPGMTTAPDDEVLSLAPKAHDLVIHALALHWANDPVGGHTLHELRACLAQAESEVTGGLSPRVLPMGEIRDLGGLLQRAGFGLPVADSFTTTVRYRDIWHLMHDLRAMGEGNALQARLRHPTRRAVFIRAAELYQTLQGPDGLIPATFEIVTLSGWAPHDSQQKPLRPGSAANRLAEALQTAELKLPTR